jgi:anti-sigma regulatory factor (Ser/Thr protein kinase)
MGDAGGGENMHEVLRLPGIDHSAARARQFVRDTLPDFPADLVESAQLLISELVTNAVLHGNPPVFVELEIAPSFLRLAVVDQGDQAPVLQEATASDGHGRGLQIVAHVADQWGVEWRNSGKSVWCSLRTDSDPCWSMN